MSIQAIPELVRLFHAHRSLPLETACRSELETLRGVLLQAIVSEKLNVKWDDVAGLEGAKASLKEA